MFSSALSSSWWLPLPTRLSLLSQQIHCLNCMLPSFENFKIIHNHAHKGQDNKTAKLAEGSSIYEHIINISPRVCGLRIRLLRTVLSFIIYIYNMPPQTSLKMHHSKQQEITDDGFTRTFSFLDLHIAALGRGS